MISAPVLDQMVQFGHIFHRLGLKQIAEHLEGFHDLDQGDHSSTRPGECFGRLEGA